MPLMKFDLIKGQRSETEIDQLLEITYEVMLSTFGAPVGDQYQVVNQHDSYEMKIKDTGLGIKRTAQVMVLTLVTRPRTTQQKQAFYRQLVDRLHSEMAIRPEDVVISLVVNQDEDWSFGNGEAQFLTGEL
ncbi:tautomerase family protein [Furfurilactobacillus curtus]|uniref:Tautomerase YrdN n=1 Tax=Furfurilactobacillus curtus TaxID=1746200 RepID=A0ABQ5JSH7_9LACO